MHLMYTLDEGGNRVYTLKVCSISIDFKNLIPKSITEINRRWQNHKVCSSRYNISESVWLVELTRSGCLARFSPDDKFSRHRVTIKKRFGVLMTQAPPAPM